MKSPALILILVTFSTTGLLAEEASEAQAEAGSRPCVEHFAEEGGFFKGKSYETWQEHEGVSYESAFRRVAQAVVEDKWGRIETEKDLGIITAGQEVTMGEGSVAPLNVLVKEQADGIVRVEANFSTAGMQKARTKDVRKALCTVVEAASE